MVRSTLIDMNPGERKCYPFTISFNKFTGSCDALSPKVCVPKETKGITVKGAGCSGRYEIFYKE